MTSRVVTIQDLKNQSPQEVVKTVLKRKRFSVRYIKNIIKQVLPDVQIDELKEEVNKFKQQSNTPVTQYEEYKPVDITITTKQKRLSPDDIITMFQSNFNNISLPSPDERKKKIPSHKIGLNPNSSNVYVRESTSGETQVHVKSIRKSS